MTGKPYQIYGYKGKQVRDNIHSHDLILAFDAFRQAPRPAEVYNMGGGRASNCSMLEAIRICEDITGRQMVWRYEEQNRTGDHIWWISGLQKFRQHYPTWSIRRSVVDILREIFEVNRSRWTV